MTQNYCEKQASQKKFMSFSIIEPKLTSKIPEPTKTF